MNPYLFTITFLMLMGFLTSSEVLRFSQSNLEQKCYLSSRASLIATEQVREWGHLEQLRGEENLEPEPLQPKPITRNQRTCHRIAPLRINTARPPDNSRLNLYRLLNEEPDKKFLYEVLAQLIRDLYQEEPFFHAISQIEYHILDHLIENKAQVLEFTTPDQISTLFFENQDLQKALYHMLQGTKKSPSLLNFLTCDPINSANAPGRKINFLFADPRILHAIFPNGQTADKLIAARQRIWEEILDQEEHRLERVKQACKGRNAFKQELKTLLTEILHSEGFDFEQYKTQVFDYGLGEPGTVIFIHDPLTGHTIREKYHPQAKIGPSTPRI